MTIKMRYDLLFKSGIKEKVIQSAAEAEHRELIQTVHDSLRDETEAVVTFGDGVAKGRFVRVSDLSQMETEVLEGDAS